MQQIEVHDYDPDWPVRFEGLARPVLDSVGALALRVEHVGSTSVPGLAAKPVIDMDVVVASADDFATARRLLERLGYEWRGDLGVDGRDAFRPPSGRVARHHLYVVADGSRAYLDHVLLRDLLRSDADLCRRYVAVKRKSAIAAGGDLEVNTALKAPFVAEALRRARARAGLPEVAYWVPSSEDLKGRRARVEAAAARPARRRPHAREPAAARAGG